MGDFAIRHYEINIHVSMDEIFSVFWNFHFYNILNTIYSHKI